MEDTLKNAADEFVTALENDTTVREFQKAREAFRNDTELHDLRSDYSQILQQLQSKQLDGTLTEEDIAQLKTLQLKINEHPSTTMMIETQDKVTGVLASCNMEMSNLLGFDFSATAAPAAAC
ncbi:MAG: YlbF family regulator [Spirochaeta sp.]|nr:YlbF family regulator [Spirochaeta sp.]